MYICLLQVKISHVKYIYAQIVSVAVGCQNVLLWTKVIDRQTSSYTGCLVRFRILLTLMRKFLIIIKTLPVVNCLDLDSFSSCVCCGSNNI